MKILWKRFKALRRNYPFFPAVMVILTKEHRYLPELNWNPNFWTQNIFRFYEKLFWRRFGIRCEMTTISTTDKSGKDILIVRAHTFEAVCALIETQIRDILSWRLKIPIKIWIPQLSVSGGFAIPASPFLLAIAIDATVAVTNTNGVTSKTFSHTCTGSNLLLWVASGSGGGSSDATSVTYNAVGLTKANTVLLQTTNASLWSLINPTTGANNVVQNVTGSGNITGGSMSFTGCQQSGVPDSHFEDTSQTGSVTSYSISTTTVANNCFLVFSGRANGGATLTAGTNTTVTQPEVGAFGDWMMRSTSAVTPAGTGTLAVTSSAQAFFGVICSFAPVAATTTSTTITTSTTVTTSTSSSTTTTSSSTSSTTTTSTTKSTSTTSSTSITGTTTSTTVTTSTTLTTSSSTSTSITTSSTTSSTTSTSSSTTTTSSSTSSTSSTTISSSTTITSAVGLTRTKSKDFIINTREH